MQKTPDLSEEKSPYLKIWFQALAFDFVFFLNLVLLGLGGFALYSWRKDNENYRNRWVKIYSIVKVAMSAVIVVAMIGIFIPTAIVAGQVRREGPCEKAFPGKVQPDFCDFSKSLESQDSSCRTFQLLCLESNATRLAVIVVTSSLILVYALNLWLGIKLVIVLKGTSEPSDVSPPLPALKEAKPHVRHQFFGGKQTLESYQSKPTDW